MTIPALVVGLGGTGTLVATHIKKELMQTLDGRWPPRDVRVLAFDTDTKQPSIGGQGQIRRAEQTMGAVQLGSGEFFFIGGNVQGLMHEVAAGKHPHLGAWLLADWYLRTLSDKTFNLNEGAGQFRQFGRLALFKDVAAPSNSTIYNTLNDALVKLKRDNPTLTSFQVFIIASLAGGTGAGMFVDVAHLIRQIAAQPNVALNGRMTIRGYLVLPDAFSRSVDAAWLRSMQARAYAAMRESRRFAVSYDYERSYPIHYHDGSGHPIWHGAIKGRLFDVIYYLDGQGGYNPLGTVKIENGIVPVIADAVSAAIDAQAGPTFMAYVANVEAERSARIARAELSSQTATFGSVGTYSIVFPINHIIESWAHDLGIEALNHLLAPTSFDPRTGLPTTLANNTNKESPGEDGRSAAQDFLRANKPVIYQRRDENGNLQTPQAEPTLLFGELARIAAEAARASNSLSLSFVQSLIGRGIVDWNPYFVPSSGDHETQRLLQRIDNILNACLYDPTGQTGQVLTSDQQKQQKEDTELGADRILTEVRAFKNRYFGDEDPRTDQPPGGLYRTALSQIVEYQTNRLNLCLDYYIQATLNGSPNRSPVEAKGGKLGFLADFLSNLLQMLEPVRGTLQHVQQLRRQQGDRRRSAIAATQTAAQVMKDSANKKGFLGRGPARGALDAQKNYLQAEMQLIEILQVEATEDAVLDTINRMIDYVHSAHQSARMWEATLARDAESLYAKLARGRKQVDSDRAAGQDAKVRLIVSDPDYERERYASYVAAVEGGWVNRLLGSVDWVLEQKQAGGRPKVELRLQLTGDSAAPQLFGGDTFDDNLSLWLTLSRQPFFPASQTESVIGYLIRHRDYRNPTQLADLIHRNSGASLNFDGGNVLSAIFLRAFFQTEEEAGHRAYLRDLIQELAQRSGQSIASDTAARENRFAQFTNSEDHFKFTLVFTQELIELERIAAYRINGASAYLGSGDQMTRGDRRLLHIFPAEVHAAEYEGRLSELNQPLRLFSDDATLLLEDMDRFRLFLLCYVYDLVQRTGIKDEKTSGQRNIWQLVISPLAEFDGFGNRAQPEEVWLTKPDNQALILNALTTFIFDGRDVRHSEGYEYQIDYDWVGQALIRERNKDVDQRLAANTAGQRNPDLLGQLDAVADPQARRELLVELARIDHIREAQGRIEGQVLPAYGERLNDPDNQKNYDIASVFALVLRDEVKSVRQIVLDRINALRQSGVNRPSNQDPWDSVPV